MKNGKQNWEQPIFKGNRCDGDAKVRHSCYCRGGTNVSKVLSL